MPHGNKGRNKINIKFDGDTVLKSETVIANYVHPFKKLKRYTLIPRKTAKMN